MRQGPIDMAAFHLIPLLVWKALLLKTEVKTGNVACDEVAGIS